MPSKISPNLPVGVPVLVAETDRHQALFVPAEIYSRIIDVDPDRITRYTGMIGSFAVVRSFDPNVRPDKVYIEAKLPIALDFGDNLAGISYSEFIGRVIKYATDESEKLRNTLNGAEHDRSANNILRDARYKSIKEFGILTSVSVTGSYGISEFFGYLGFIEDESVLPSALVMALACVVLGGSYSWLHKAVDEREARVQLESQKQSHTELSSLLTNFDRIINFLKSSRIVTV